LHGKLFLHGVASRFISKTKSKGAYMMKLNENPCIILDENGGKQITTYHETKVGKHLFHVTSVFLGKVELSTALENLAVSKILANESVGTATEGWTNP
jgi:hypothetical protein